MLGAKCQWSGGIYEGLVDFLAGLCGFYDGVLDKMGASVIACGQRSQDLETFKRV